MFRRLVSIKILPVLLFLFLAPRAAEAQNVVVRDTLTNQVIANGATVNLGDTAVNTIAQRVFSITSQASLPIQMTGCTLIPAGGAVSITTCPGTLYPGLPSSMTVRLLSGTSGTFGATVYGEVGLFSFQVTGRVLESSPSIRVETEAGSVINKNTAFNFGSTPINTALEQKFRIKNLGAQALSVNMSVTGTGYLLSSPPASSVPAGGETTFKIRLHSLTSGPFTGNVSISNNDPNDNPFNFSLSGSVAPAQVPRIRVVDTVGGLAVSRYGTVDMGSTLVNSPLSRTFTIYNDGNVPLTITGSTVTVSGTGFSLSSSSSLSSIAPGGSGSFVVRFLSATTGTFNGSVTIYSNDSGNSPFQFNLTAAAVPQAVPRIRVTDESGTTVPHGGTYPYGTIQPNQWVEKTFRVWNDGNAVLSLGGISGGGTYFSVTQTPPNSINPGTSGTFRLLFYSPVAGDFSGLYSFSTNDPSRSYYSLSVTASVPGPRLRVLASGTTPVVSGGVYLFPNTPVGVAASRGFTVFNDGNQTLTISNFTLSTAGGFSIVVHPPSSIAPGTSGAFRIQLLSNTPGQYTATVSFNSNAPGQSPFSFELRGTVEPSGPAPDIRVVSGDGVTIPNGGLYTSFPSTVPNTPVSRAFTIYNDGNAPLTISNPGSLVSGTGFSLIVVPPSSIPAGGSGIFRVRLMTLTAGTFTGTVSIQSNDPDENPFTFQIRGTVTN